MGTLENVYSSSCTALMMCIFADQCTVVVIYFEATVRTSDPHFILHVGFKLAAHFFLTSYLEQLYVCVKFAQRDFKPDLE